jgi:hypothetical protein
MTYSTSYSSSTQSGTSTGVAVDTSTNDESESYSLTVDMTTQTSSPDDSDGLAAVVGGSATAIGDDTLTMGDISGELIDSGAVTSADLSATMVAASEDGESATALTDTYADVSDGTEVLFGYTVNTQSSTQNATGSTATSTSTTNLVAYEIDPDAAINTTGPVAGDDAADTISGDDLSGADDQPEPDSTPSDVEDNGSLDGNFASMEFEGFVAGEDTFVSLDAYTLAVEDEISISDGILVLAVE